MRNGNKVGVLFSMNGKNHITMISGKSKNRFKRLIKNFVDNKGIINNPQDDDTFTYINIHTVLDEIESTFTNLKNTPAAEKISNNALKLVSTIKAQQEDEDDDDDDEDD